jgi:hypothetical protein
VDSNSRTTRPPSASLGAFLTALDLFVCLILTAMTWYLADGDPFDDAHFHIGLMEQLSEHDHDSEPTTFGNEYAALSVMPECAGVVESSPFKADESPVLVVTKLSNGVNIEPLMPVCVKPEVVEEPACVESSCAGVTGLSIPDPVVRPTVQKVFSGKIRRAKSKAMAQKLELRKRLKTEEQDQALILAPAMRAKLRSRNEAAVSRCFKMSLSDNLLSELIDSVEEIVVLRERLRHLELKNRNGCEACHRR